MTALSDISIETERNHRELTAWDALVGDGALADAGVSKSGEPLTDIDGAADLTVDELIVTRDALNHRIRTITKP